LLCGLVVLPSRRLPALAGLAPGVAAPRDVPVGISLVGIVLPNYI